VKVESGKSELIAIIGEGIKLLCSKKFVSLGLLADGTRVDHENMVQSRDQR